MWDRIVKASRDSGEPIRGFSNGIEESLLRREGTAGTGGKMIKTTYQDAAEATDLQTRNAFHETDGIQRIYNLVTTKSNVYAIWITVGYFEVTRTDFTKPVDVKDSTTHWTEVGELGEDTGDVRRHRAFYIVDRSIPVGYEAGHRHNIDKAILVKRFIE
jgi:hypothetical protein